MNWGKGITIAIVAFMAFILGMVYKANQTDPDLQSEDYYKREIGYQEDINAKSNMMHFKEDVQVMMGEDSVVLQFPEDCMGHHIEGEVHFYRPDNAALDKHFPMHVEGNQQKFWKGGLMQGHYIMKADWHMNGHHYMTEKEIEVK